MRALRHDMEAVAARASVSRSSRPVIGYPQCSVRTRVECRSSSCVSIRPAMCRNVSPPQAFRSRAMAAHAQDGSCVPPSRDRTKCRCDWLSCQTVRRSCASPAESRAPPRAGVIQHPPMSWQWGATSLMQASWSTPMVANSTVPRRHWSVVSAVRSTELPQPGVPAAATSADASSDDRERQPLSFRPRLMAGPLWIAFRFCCP